MHLMPRDEGSPDIVRIVYVPEAVSYDLSSSMVMGIKHGKACQWEGMARASTVPTLQPLAPAVAFPSGRLAMVA